MAPTFLRVKAQFLPSAHIQPFTTCPIPSPPFPPPCLPFLPLLQHTGPLAVPPTRQVLSCPRAFARAVPSAYNTLPADVPTSSFTSFRSLPRCHLLSEASLRTLLKMANPHVSLGVSETVWQSLHKFSVESPCNPAMPLVGARTGEMKTHGHTKPARPGPQQRCLQQPRVKPDPPEGVRLSPLPGQQLGVRWEPPRSWPFPEIFSLKYRIRYKRHGAARFRQVGPIEATSFTLRAVRPRARYCVQVAAEDLTDYGESSDWSLPATTLVMPRH
nr:interleukin-27 subunit beta isoform X1 [Microcebus murinus]